MSVRTVRAAAAVVCAAALAACTTSQHPRPTAGLERLAPAASLQAAASAPLAGARPDYYVVVSGLKVVVRASDDGHVTGSVAIPGAAGTPRVFVGAEVFGGTDDRHFVILLSRGGDLPGVAKATLLLLAVSPDGRPGRLVPLNVDNKGMPVIGAALSPDDKMLALSMTHEFPPGEALYGSVEVINLATGATRTWAGQSAPGHWPGTPAWAGNGMVVVPWWHSASQAMIPAAITGVRELETAVAGGSLLTVRPVTFPAPVPELESAIVAPGGADVIVSSCRAGPHDTATARVLELSAADGRLVRVLRTQTARVPAGADISDAIGLTCGVLSAASGGQVLAQAFAFGRIDDGAFISLPGTAPDGAPVSAAW